MVVPAVVLAAPASGSGKTTLSTGLMGALRAAGHRVAPFKVGPDYIDPSYHAVAADRVGRNLDPVLVGADTVAPLYKSGSAGCDIAIIEGVMGLFDGRIIPGDRAPIAAGSTAQVAEILGAPVILVVDGSGHGHTLAAVLQGLVGYASSVRVVGVILNRVGSERHEAVLRDACERAGMAVFGVVRRDPAMTLPSRHLGLVPAAEQVQQGIDAVAAMVEVARAELDLDAIVAAADSRVADVAPWNPRTALGDEFAAPTTRPRIAVAGGPAFTFSYAEHGELLAAAGAEIVTFDPLRDRLPDDAAGIVIGGGFPEVHAAELSANDPLRRDIRRAADRGVPIHAECAGLLYLGTELDGSPMSGVLSIHGHFGSRLTLGYRDAVAVTDSALFRVGERVTGHEFHRTGIQPMADAAVAPAWGWRDGAARTEGVVHGGVHASYLHVHPAAVPHAVGRFVAAAAEFAARPGDIAAVDGH
ncbi:cobyrinate a,c-diamide synthase [Jongsikchunia kroppenstedtii]|uniref:cobyrinate a,c-diamide synthase n=1 Tax=Jongsikchunia kroppenstedtii TaxID=1121721 RepID=UPI0003769426|nr:cobyrinate a,c-diamide synthase [Jongsikchunia kroppenstedtii]